MKKNPLNKLLQLTPAEVALLVAKKKPTVIRGIDGADGADGEKGEEGLKGEVGPKGERGETGLTGETGARGAKGEKGDRGPIGLQGVPGVQGEKGLDGRQGAQGETGPRGPKGDKGDKGAKGAKGDKGINWRGKWSSDVSYKIDDAVEYKGASWIAVKNIKLGSMAPTKVSKNWDLLADRGEDGKDGPQGLKGPRGLTGPQGPQGEQGTSGEAKRDFIAGEVIPAYKVVRIGSDGKVYLSDKDTPAHNCDFVGISTNSANTNETVTVQNGGYLIVGGAVGNATDEVYNGANGVLDTTVPTTGFFLRVGEMISNTEMLIRIDETIIL